MESAGRIRVHERTSGRGGRSGGIRRDVAAGGPFRRLRDCLALTVINGDGGDIGGSLDSYGSLGFRIDFSKGQRKTPETEAKRRNPAMALAP